MCHCTTVPVGPGLGLDHVAEDQQTLQQVVVAVLGDGVQETVGVPEPADNGKLILNGFVQRLPQRARDPKLKFHSAQHDCRYRYKTGNLNPLYPRHWRTISLLSCCSFTQPMLR